MQGAIEGVDEDKHALVTFIRQFWLSAKGHSTKDELYANIKGKVNSEKKALELLDDLAASSSRYAAILNPSDEMWNKFQGHESIKYQIEVLNFIRVSQGRPLLLSALAKFSSNPKQLEKILKAIVNWSVRLLISGKLGSGSLEEKYGEVGRAVISDKAKNVAQITDLSSRLCLHTHQFEAAFATADVSKGYLAKYYLSGHLRSMKKQAQVFKKRITHTGTYRKKAD